jgi:type IV pilus assembly protein PilB
MDHQTTHSGQAVVGLVNRLLRDAIQRRASDVHFEPTDRQMLVRLRLDGLLHDVEQLPRQIADNIIARLKVMAGLLTYRVDIPQEGSLSANDIVPDGDDAAALDLRVATFPTIRGERVVVRILYSGSGISDLTDLGLAPETVTALSRAAEASAGMILVTGPAGSGKSTTLYALARHIHRVSPGRSVVALEDPVEQRVDGMTQIQIAPHGELNYPRALRSLLRQDPEVLLIGEVRDAHTANVIVEASLTGHLVMTTMHSGDPAEAIVRMLEMDIPPYQLVSTLNLVCTQRLVRRLCLDCRRDTKRQDEPFEHVGCDTCYQTGYRGRVACGQLLELNEHVRSAIVAKASSSELRTIAAEQGPNLLEDANRLVRTALTDQAEVRRIIG